MSKSCGTKGGGCPMSWIIFGVFAGLIVGFFAQNMGIWIGVGAGVGLVIYLIRSMGSSGGCSCSAEKPDSKDSD
jgi:hypothetical protein